MSDFKNKMNEQKKIRVIVADDQQLVREGIATLLSFEQGIEVVGRAHDGQQAVMLAQETQPDLILMDVRMPNMTGIEATAKLRQLLPTCLIVLLTTLDDDEYVVQSLRARARRHASRCRRLFA